MYNLKCNQPERFTLAIYRPQDVQTCSTYTGTCFLQWICPCELTSNVICLYLIVSVHHTIYDVKDHGATRPGTTILLLIACNPSSRQEWQKVTSSFPPQNPSCWWTWRDCKPRWPQKPKKQVLKYSHWAGGRFHVFPESQGCGKCSGFSSQMQFSSPDGLKPAEYPSLWSLMATKNKGKRTFLSKTPNLGYQ